MLEGLLGDRILRAGRAVGELGRSWASVVGERLAEESAPVSLDDQGALLVRASSAAWAAQVRFLSTEIAEAANRLLGRRSGGFGAGRGGPPDRLERGVWGSRKLVEYSSVLKPSNVSPFPLSGPRVSGPVSPCADARGRR